MNIKKRLINSKQITNSDRPEARLGVELVAVQCKHFVVVDGRTFQHDGRRLSLVLTQQHELHSTLVNDAVCYHCVTDLQHLAPQRD